MQHIKVDKKLSKDQVKLLNKVLAKGGLVVYPTETCYGLGVDATSQTAVDKLLKFKRRREGKPLSVLFSDINLVENYVDLNSTAKSLYQRFLPGPMTIISKAKKSKFCLGVCSELDAVGVRISSHPVAMQMAQIYQKPITATSANPSWQKKPYSYQDFLAITSEKQQQLIDLFLDFGELPKRKTSTVVDTTLDQAMIIRDGLIEDIGEQIFQSHSPIQTKDFAKNILYRFYNDLRTRGLVIALLGDLGVGKTIFTKGLGEFLKIKQIINSPSYNLVNEYPFNRHQIEGLMHHLDLWRLPDDFKFKQLGIDKFFHKNNLIVVEWADKKLDELIKLVREYNTSLIQLNIKQVDQSRKFYLNKVFVLEE